MGPSPKEEGMQRIAIIGMPGSGSVSLTRDLRRLGLDMTHESSDGKDGSVSWLHLSLYVNTVSNSSCARFIRGGWHVQLIAPDVPCPSDNGEGHWTLVRKVRKCWLDQCQAALDRWAGCAAKGNCPLPFLPKPQILIRHPLRTLESLAAGFCPRSPTDEVPLLTAAKSLFAFPRLDNASTLNCMDAFARFWLDFYDTAKSVQPDLSLWLRREPLIACEVIEAVSPLATLVDTPRLLRAKRACRAVHWWQQNPRLFILALRQRIAELRSDGLAGDAVNRRNNKHKATRLALFLSGHGSRSPVTTSISTPSVKLHYSFFTPDIADALRIAAKELGYYDPTDEVSA